MNERTRRIVTLVALMGLLAGCGGGETPTSAPPAQASPMPEATIPPAATLEPLQAVIVDVVNDVDAHSEPEEDWVEAVADMIIHPGGEVWAQEASTSRVAVAEDLVRVAPNTIFTLGQPDADTLQLTLDEGQVWVNVEELEEGETFQVETPAAVASVRGTRFSARVASDGATIVSTQVGTVTVSAVASTVVVTPGLQTTVPAGEPPGEAEPMSPEEQMRWGMAAGSGLDVALPVIGSAEVFTYAGHPQNRSCSQGRYFALGLWDSDLDEHWHVIYDLQAGTPFTVALPADTSDIALSPTDDLLAYYEAGELCVVGTDGTNPFCWDASSDQFYWSPDGEWLLYYRWTEDMANLFKGRPDGSDVTQLTNYSGGEIISNPAWAPDGSGIAYYRHTEHGVPANLWVMGADGSDAHEIFQGVRYYDPPAWTPDGTLLAVPGYYDQDSGEGGGLWMVPVNGSDPWMVPGTDGWSCYGSVWSPTGSGWPLFFTAYDPGKEYHPAQSGQRWYAPDTDRGPVHFANATWGPAWCPNGAVWVGFGFGRGSQEASWTEVHFFQTEPDFWPW